MQRAVIIGLIMVMLMFVMSGCQTDSPATNGGELSGVITIAGSTSVQPFSDRLKETFEDKFPNVTINVQGGGSTAGGTSVLSGAAQIGALSRELKDEEKAQLNEIIVAQDGIAVIVHPSNPVNNLTLEQIRKIYTGEITNWEQVGGQNQQINVVTREEGSGTRGAFEDIVMAKQEMSGTIITQGSQGAVMASVEGDVQSIGYTSIAALTDTVKAVSVDGVAPSTETIQDGSYKVARPFLYVTKSEPQGLIKAFVDFVLSDEGQSIAYNIGLTPVK